MRYECVGGPMDGQFVEAPEELGGFKYWPPSTPEDVLQARSGPGPSILPEGNKDVYAGYYLRRGDRFVWDGDE